MSPVRQSVSRWCFSALALDTLAAEARALGLESIELLDPPDWAVVARHGLICAMANAPAPCTIEQGINRREAHAALLEAYAVRLRECAAAGVPNLIVFAGNRCGIGDEEGMEACAEFLHRIVGEAERAGVTLCMELLNSRIDHPDYQCDRTAWGVELCERVGSERFKLLYDIYHMQIMEGDVIRTIQRAHACIGHFHTAGNPGRHELDDTQELNYPAIVRAIRATGFRGFLGHEFVPRGEPLAALRAAVALCGG
jgi:hydroxypyruvate isomerase